MVTGPIILPVSFQLLFGTIALILHGFLALQVYRSASDNGMSPIGWCLFYFFTGPIGWIVFQLVRDASTSGGGDSAAPADPLRERVVDERDTGYQSRKLYAHLPRPSINFVDQNLQELMSAGDWKVASEHAKEMEKLAREDGNLGLADDYRRMFLWIDMRVNPFEHK